MKRKDELGYLFVVGGPGGSGSSVISKMLANYFDLRRVYGGQLFRQYVADMGHENLEDGYRALGSEKLLEVDKMVDDGLREEAMKPDVLIESKVFAGIVERENIPCTVRIWLTASLHTRIMRHIKREKGLGFFEVVKRYFEERRDLSLRYREDAKRYRELYGINYSRPYEYNDIVIDSSRMDEEETFNLILRLLKDGRYLKKE